MEDVKAERSGTKLLFLFLPSKRSDSDLEGEEFLDTCLDLVITFLEGVELK